MFAGIAPKCPGCGSARISYREFVLTAWPVFLVNAVEGKADLGDGDVVPYVDEAEWRPGEYFCGSCKRSFQTLAEIDPAFPGKKRDDEKRD